MEIHGRGQCGKGIDRPVIGTYDNVADLQTGCLCGSSGSYVGNNDAPASGKTEPLGQAGSDVLRDRSDLDPMHVSLLAQTLIDETHDAGRNREAQALAASAL